MKLDLQRVRDNVVAASTEDLLDRATVYRNDMEADALAIIDDELERRGITSADRALHEAQRREAPLILDHGSARPCTFCHRPAIHGAWQWHRLWGRIPLLPRWHWYCETCLPSQQDRRDGAPA